MTVRLRSYAARRFACDGGAASAATTTAAVAASFSFSLSLSLLSAEAPEASFCPVALLLLRFSFVVVIIIVVAGVTVAAAVLAIAEAEGSAMAPSALVGRRCFALGMRPACSFRTTAMISPSPLAPPSWSSTRVRKFRPPEEVRPPMLVVK